MKFEILKSYDILYIGCNFMTKSYSFEYKGTILTSPEAPQMIVSSYLRVMPHPYCMLPGPKQVFFQFPI